MTKEPLEMGMLNLVWH